MQAKIVHRRAMEHETELLWNSFARRMHQWIFRWSERWTLNDWEHRAFTARHEYIWIYWSWSAVVQDEYAWMSVANEEAPFLIEFRCPQFVWIWCVECDAAWMLCFCNLRVWIWTRWIQYVLILYVRCECEMWGTNRHDTHNQSGNLSRKIDFLYAASLQFIPSVCCVHAPCTSTSMHILKGYTQDTTRVRTAAVHTSQLLFSIGALRALWTNKRNERRAAQHTWEIELLNAHAPKISAPRILTKINVICRHAYNRRTHTQRPEFPLTHAHATVYWMLALTVRQLNHFMISNWTMIWGICWWMKKKLMEK